MSVAAKICGVSSEEAVAAAAEGGARYLGFVFYPPSPRAVDAAAAARLCAAAPAGILKVGLFVDAGDDAIAAVLGHAPLDLLQFHGGESVARVAAARRRFGLPIVKAVAIAGPADLATAARYQGAADLLLFDTRPPRRADALPGGNGLPFDWELLAGRSWQVPWILSGGLTPETVAQAVRISGAAIVDVSSGVERRRGDKDPERIRAFLAAAHAL